MPHCFAKFEYQLRNFSTVIHFKSGAKLYVNSKYLREIFIILSIRRFGKNGLGTNGLSRNSPGKTEVWVKRS